MLILQESLRADVTCVEYDPECDRATPFSNRAAPDRMPLLQMRAHDSTTAISISNLWSGVPPIERRALLHSVPLLWDYAHAAGWDVRPVGSGWVTDQDPKPGSPLADERRLALWLSPERASARP